MPNPMYVSGGAAHLALLLLPTAVVMDLQPHSSLCSVCVCTVAVTRLCGSSLVISDVCSRSTRTIAVPGRGNNIRGKASRNRIHN